MMLVHRVSLIVSCEYLKWKADIRFQSSLGGWGGVAVEIYILENTHTQLDKIDFLHVHSSAHVNRQVPHVTAVRANGELMGLAKMPIT